MHVFTQSFTSLLNFVFHYLGWPWDSDDYCSPKEKGRYALQGGVETAPPALTCDPSAMSIKEIKEAIKRAGLTAQTKGLSEKSEFVELLRSKVN